MSKNLPVLLKKITYVKSKAKVLYHTKYNEYWGENVKLFKVNDFIAELTQHIPEKRKHLIWYYGWYASRTQGKARKDGSLKKFGYASKIEDTLKPDDNMEILSNKYSNQSWARLMQKVYEIYPLVCPKCQSEMKIVAIIMNVDEIQKILNHLKRNKSPPFSNIKQIA